MKKRKPATAASWPAKPLPAQHKELLLDGRYSAAEFERMGLGLVPRTAQDKWFIFLDGEWLNFHRSRSGSCIFRLQLLPEKEWISAPRVLVNQDPAQFRGADDEYNVALLNYLVETLLLGRFAPFPQAKQFNAADQQRHKEHVMGKDDQKGETSLKLSNGNKGH